MEISKRKFVSVSGVRGKIFRIIVIPSFTPAREKTLLPELRRKFLLSFQGLKEKRPIMPG
jgi:hypothetical protein